MCISNCSKILVTGLALSQINTITKAFIQTRSRGRKCCVYTVGASRGIRSIILTSLHPESKCLELASDSLVEIKAYNHTVKLDVLNGHPKGFYIRVYSKCLYPADAQLNICSIHW